jgi:hypothetical protein
MSDSDDRARRSKRDDGLALIALLLGAALAYQGRHIPIELGAGIALGLGGALLAVRGGRPIEGRGWLVCALLVGAGALLACGVLAFFQEWDAGQWLADGPQSATAPASLRELYRTVAGLRVVGLAGSLIFLLGAIVNRMRTDESEPQKEKGPD